MDECIERTFTEYDDSIRNLLGRQNTIHNDVIDGKTIGEDKKEGVRCMLGLISAGVYGSR